MGRNTSGLVPERLTIGFVFDDSLDRNDGIQQYIKTMSAELQSRGHRVRYIVGESEQRDGVYSLAKNVSVTANKNRLSMPLPAMTKKIDALFDKESFDVLHVSLLYSPLLAGRVIMRAPNTTAIIGSYHIVGHSALERFGTKTLARLQKKSLRRFDTIVAVSEAARHYANTYSNVSIETISPNVVNVAAFKNAPVFKRYDDAVKTIVFLGRLVERKGAQHLIESLPYLSQSLGEWRLIICGDGSLRESLEKRVAELGFEKNVEFTGFIDEADKPRYLASADIAVFPATGGESFGIVLIEAMAAGTKVVLGGNNEGYTTVLQDGPGLLFDPYDPKGVADKISTFLLDASMRKKADAWRKKTISKYDVKNVANQVEELYKHAIIKRKIR